MDANDGQWFIPLQEYFDSFSDTQANPDTLTKHQTYWAAFELPDDEQHNETLTITSQVAQTLYVSAYTYDGQHIGNGACIDNLGSSSLWFYLPKIGSWQGIWWTGNTHFGAIEVDAGESFEIHADVKFSHDDLRPHDYSIVVWADIEPVTMESTYEGHVNRVFPSYRIE